MNSTIGKNIRLTVFGGSHEEHIGVSIEGFPEGSLDKNAIDWKKLQSFLDRRAPGKNQYSTPRNEADIPIQIGTDPVTYIIKNTDIKPSDYSNLKTVPRPGHSDLTARLKYGDSINMSGGGPFSGRMTAPLCVAGGIALQYLEKLGLSIEGRLVSAGGASGDSMWKNIDAAKADGDSVGGLISVTVTGCLSGIGGPMYDGLESLISPIVFGIPGVKGLSFGAGFKVADMRGSENNDTIYHDGMVFKTKTNNAGGILGGITNGMPITLDVALKPTSSIALPQESVDMETNEPCQLIVNGRHDPCIAVRAVPAIEAAVALGILDGMSEDPYIMPKSGECDDLASIRDEIDSVDEKLSALLTKRMELSLSVAKFKDRENLPVLNVKREKEVLQSVSKDLPSNLRFPIKTVYRTIMDVSKGYQNQYLHRTSPLQLEIEQAQENTPALFPQEATVACQGIDGSYSESAAMKIFKDPHVTFVETFEAVFNAVDKGLCQYGILPLENSSHGSVGQVYDLMNDFNFHIVRGLKMHIHHSLLTKGEGNKSQITEIISHRQAIGQCSQFLSTLEGVKISICENTAQAAKIVSERNEPNIAAISSKHCANLYGLTSVSNDIQNTDNNYTRFICISKSMFIYPGSNKISIMLSLPHVAGSLYSTIAKFATLGINLTKIESRPISGSDFEFMFYLDFEGSTLSEDIISILSELDNQGGHITFLGNYSEII